MTLRLFLGIDIPDEIAVTLIPMQCGLDKARFSPRDNFHITLRFIGDLVVNDTTELDAMVEKIKLKPFELKLKSVDFFGKEKPHSIHTLVENSEELNILAGRCENACRKLGHEPETRKYTPHVTLAYLGAYVNLRDVLEWKARHTTYKSKPFMVDRFYLYSSHMGNGPSYYNIEAEYPLLG